MGLGSSRVLKQVFDLNSISRLFITTALVATPLSAPVFAADLAAVQVAQANPAQSRARFSIPAQPLPNALILFGRQSGLQVSTQGDVPSGIQSPGVTGEFTPHEALARLLAGTGLTYRFNDAQTVTLIPAPQGSGAAVLPPVTVEGMQPVVPITATSHNLTEAYPGGQVARGGSLGMLGVRDVMDTPFSTVNYTSELMENQQARTAADTLINDPSVRLSTGSNGFDDTFVIRGYAVPAGDVGFNGLYGLVSSNRVPAQIVERIELLKGPGALINGMAPGSSIGGGINIIGKRAGEESLTRLTSTYISEANFGVHADVARRAGTNNEWGIRFNGLLRDGEASIVDSDVETNLGALALDFRGERLRWTLDLISQRDSTDNFRPQISLLSTLSAIPEPPDARSNWYPGTKLLQKDNTIASRLEFDLTESLTLYTALGFRDGRNEQTFPSSSVAVNALGNFTVQNNYYDSYNRTISGTAGARWRFDTESVGHTVNAAFSGFHREEGNAYVTGAQRASNIYNPSPLPAITNPRINPQRAAEALMTSVAVADTMSFMNERLLLTLGARDQRIQQEVFSTATGAKTSSGDSSEVSPLGAVLFKPWQDVSLYANYAEGLTRGQTVGAGYANTGSVLAPYTSKQYETGIKVDWGSFSTTAAVFQIQRPNSMRNASNELAYDGEQRNRGLELSTFGEFQPGLRAMAGVTFLDPELTKTAVAADKGKDAAGMPDMMASAGLDWDTPWIRGLALNGRAIYTSGAYLTNANTTQFDDWIRYDIGARYRTDVAGTPVVFRANIENIFDKNYWLTTGTYVTVGAPRTFILSASADF
jgi:iron complex outermembrane receptor protein